MNTKPSQPLVKETLRLAVAYRSAESGAEEREALRALMSYLVGTPRFTKAQGMAPHRDAPLPEPTSKAYRRGGVARQILKSRGVMLRNPYTPGNPRHEAFILGFFEAGSIDPSHDTKTPST